MTAQVHGIPKGKHRQYCVDKMLALETIVAARPIDRQVVAHDFRFNGACISTDAGKYLVYRKAYEGAANHHQTELRIKKVEQLDCEEATLEIERCELSQMAVFDARFFWYRDELHISYGGHAGPFAKQADTMFIAKIDVAGGVSNQLELRLPWRQKREKNWLMFEHAGELYCLYQSNPLTILKVDATSGLCEVAYQHLKGAVWPYGEIRGGATPHEVDGEFYHFFHATEIFRGYDCIYTMGVFTFDAKPPFALRRCSLRPLLHSGLARPKFPVPFVVFPASAELHNNKGKLEWEISIGVFDRETHLTRWNFNDVEDNLNERQRLGYV